MRYGLPDNHGLSAAILDALLFYQNGNPSLTDAQFDALALGVGRGDSALVVSPTSTGKTHIALWAVASALARGDGAVYLVTHRALARQKFNDFARDLVPRFMQGDETGLVLATGDEVVDAAGIERSDPLSARTLVATYEKYLALLCGAGLPRTMSQTVIVCDEIQLVGDLHRGRDVEILLTLIRNAGCRQLIGLSAVLERRDAEALSSWLGVHLVFRPSREKHLEYECWTPDGIFVARSDRPGALPENRSVPFGLSIDPISALQHVLSSHDPQKPVIVFCMRKADTYTLARAFAGVCRAAQTAAVASPQLPLQFDELPETSANVLLADTLGIGIAVHSADLTEQERNIVESMLLDNKLDVVFATSTLAAGVNFPLGTAIFAGWTRWDSARGGRVAIGTGEFHNMAGRAGRLGFEHGRGRVIFFADRHDLAQAKRYLDLDALTTLEPRIEQERFGQIALQLVASKLCADRQSIEDVVCGTFSGIAEQSRNRAGLAHWKRTLVESVDRLILEGLISDLDGGRLTVTPFGKAVALSGLLPDTGIYLLRFLAREANDLASLLPSRTSPGNVDQLATRVFTACLRSPEFRPETGKSPTRFLPYPLDKAILVSAKDYGSTFPQADVLADPPPFNGAKLAVRWINGETLRGLEKTLPDLSAGMLRDMLRDLAWTLHGMSAVSMAASDARVPIDARPRVLGDLKGSLTALGTLPRMIGRLGARIAEGLPDDVLWLAQIAKVSDKYRLTRSEILALRSIGYSSIEQLMLGSAEADAARCRAFAKAKPTPQAKSSWLRDACRDWKATLRKQACDRQMKKAARCPEAELIPRIYAATGKDFEQAFEDALTAVGIGFEKLDAGAKTGAPDYLVTLTGCPPLVVELKSRAAGNLVAYNPAVEVLAASEVHGFRDASCVTICHPGVDPAVAPVIAGSGRLCVVESADFVDALLRLCQGNLTQAELWQWLASPGQALVSDLFYTSRRDVRLAAG